MFKTIYQSPFLKFKVEDIRQIRITKDGLQKIVRGKEEPEPIACFKSGKTKYERHFLNPKDEEDDNGGAVQKALDQTTST